jgi:alpha-tubulin suppressor-like RCC1 family protein
VKVSGIIANVTFTAVCAGGVHTVLLSSDGRIFSFGRNKYGQLGDGTTLNRASPILVNGIPLNVNITSIAAGGGHSIALTSEGRLITWGLNDNGQLSNNQNNTEFNVSPKMMDVNMPFLKVSAGGYCNAAISYSGLLYTWGDNSYGQLGDGSRVKHSDPNRVVRTQKMYSFRSISSGYVHTVAITADGTTYSWGINNFGQLGDGTFTSRLTPVKALTSTELSLISAGRYHTIATSLTGQVHGWGSNKYGQIGTGASEQYYAVPFMLSTLSNVDYIAAGGEHSVALSNGRVFTWGRNDRGQVGDGNLFLLL